MKLKKKKNQKYQLFSVGFEKDPSCLVLTSLSCSSCLCPRRYRYSMCITSVLLMRALTLNSSRIRGTKPGFSRPAWRNCRYRARTCFCSLLWRMVRPQRWAESQGNIHCSTTVLLSSRVWRCHLRCEVDEKKIPNRRVWGKSIYVKYDKHTHV